MHPDNADPAPRFDPGPASWSLDLSTGELRSSAARSRMLGFDPTDAGTTAQWWDRVLHPDERFAVQTARSRYLQGEESGYRSEYRAQRADGQWIWLLEIGCFERDPAGRAVRVEGVLLDITVEHEAQFRTQQRMERLSTVFDNTFQFVGLFLPSGIPLEINRPSLQASGLSIGEVDKPLWDSTLCRNQTAAEIQWMKDGFALARRGHSSRVQLTILPRLSQTGTRRIIDLALVPIIDDDNQVVAVLSEGRDVTDIVDAQEALRTVERRLAIAVSTANLGLWDVDVQTGKGWVNDRYWTMLGYEPRETPLTRDKLLTLIHPDDLPATLDVTSRWEAGASSDLQVEYRLRTKDGSYRWLHCTGRSTRDSEGRLRMAGVHLDITERKEAETRQRTAERLESVGKLAAGVAHEINTPVQFVSDSIYFVRDGLYELLALTDRLKAIASRDQCNANSVTALSAHLPYLIEHLPKALERSLDGLKRVAEIVGSMRELAHPDRPEMSDIDVNHVIQNALVVARSEYKYNAEVRTELSPLPLVRCHAGELNQVILNLVINASHAIAELVGDSGRQGVISVSTRHEGDSVLISVADTGAGIPESIRHRIFEPFFTTKEVGRGTGQGLAITHNIIVKRHGGSIDFESNVGKGTAFHVRLPCDGRVEQAA